MSYGRIFFTAAGSGFFIFAPSIVYGFHTVNYDSAFCAYLDEIWGQMRADRLKRYQEYLDSGFLYVALYRPPYGAYDTYKGKDPYQHSMEILKSTRLIENHTKNNKQ